MMGGGFPKPTQSIRELRAKPYPFCASMHKTSVTLVGVLLLCAVLVQAQTADSIKPQGQNDEVVRVFTQLVQTDVMVFDKQGRFVKDLKREDFEVRIDGKPRPVGFFDRVQAGTINEEAHLAPARGNQTAAKRQAEAALGRARAVCV